MTFKSKPKPAEPMILEECKQLMMEITAKMQDDFNPNDFEERFLISMEERLQKYGEKAAVSAKQHKVLQDIHNTAMNGRQQRCGGIR